MSESFGLEENNDFSLDVVKSLKAFDLKMKFLTARVDYVKGIYMNDYIIDIKKISLRNEKSKPWYVRKFIFKGQVMQDQLTLEDYDFKKDDFIVVLDSRGRSRSFPDNREFSNRILGHGMSIFPSPNFKHICHTQMEIPIYTPPEQPPEGIIECEQKHNRFNPIQLKFDLSKLCVSNTCTRNYDGFSKFIDKERPNDIATFRIYQVKKEEERDDHRMRKIKVLEMKCDFVDSKEYEEGQFYGCDNEDETPKVVIEKQFIPVPKLCFEPSTKYLCHFVNRKGGGIRWVFVTGTEQGERDWKERCIFTVKLLTSEHPKNSSNIHFLNLIFSDGNVFRIPRIFL